MVLTQPVIMPWGAKKNSSRVGSSMQTRRRCLCPSAVPRRRAIVSSIRWRRGGRASALWSKGRASGYRSTWTMDRQAAVCGHNFSIAWGSWATPSARRSSCCLPRPITASTSRLSAVGGGWNGIGMAPHGAMGRRCWSGRSGCRGKGCIRESSAAATCRPKVWRSVRRRCERWKHAANAIRFCLHGTC